MMATPSQFKIRDDFIFDPSLVLYLPLYKLDGSSFMSRDAYGRLCTVTGALWTPKGRSFDGVDDVITCPELLSSVANFTVILWYKRTALGPTRGFWGINVGSTRLGSFSAQEANQIYFYISNGALSTGRFPQTDIIGTWYCYALTFDGSQATNADKAKAYLGTTTSVLAQQTVTFEDAAMPTQTANNVGYNFLLGKLPWVAGSFLDGDIGEIAVYLKTSSLLELQSFQLATRWRYQ